MFKINTNAKTTTKKTPDTFNFYLGPRSSYSKENTNRNQKELHFKELKFEQYVTSIKQTF